MTSLSRTLTGTFSSIVCVCLRIVVFTQSLVSGSFVSLRWTEVVLGLSVCLSLSLCLCICLSLCLCLSVSHSPREAGNVWCPSPVWSLRAVIWFPFPIFSSFFLPSPLAFSANGPFSWLFFQKTLKYFSLRVRLFCLALVEQLGDDGRWYVQLAAI